MPVKTITNVSLNNNEASITTSSNHGLTSGDYITIAGVSASVFNGSFTVLNVPSSSIFTYAKTASNVTSVPASGSVIYAAFNANAKPAYMYDKTTDTWFPISGQIDTGKNYVWTGSQLYEATVTFDAQIQTQSIIANGTASVNGSASFNGPLNINGGINVYTNATARNSAIPSPTTGTMTYISSTKKLEIWDGDQWDIVVTANQ